MERQSTHIGKNQVLNGRARNAVDDRERDVLFLWKMRQEIAKTKAASLCYAKSRKTLGSTASSGLSRRSPGRRSGQTRRNETGPDGGQCQIFANPGCPWLMVFLFFLLNDRNVLSRNVAVLSFASFPPPPPTHYASTVSFELRTIGTNRV